MTTPARANLVLPRPLPRSVVELDFLGSAPLVVRGVPFAVTRSSNGTYFDSAGTLQTASSNVARLNHNPLTLAPLGLLVEEQRTNSIRNNTMQGASAGTPGTLPTNWNANVIGLTRTIVGTGTENGVTYIDIRVNGTTTSQFGAITFEPTNTVAASAGQVWAGSSFLKLVGGDFTNIGVVGLAFYAYTSAPAYISAVTTAASVDSTLTRFSNIGTLPATTAYVQPAFFFNTTAASGQAVDFTIRIGMPQTELGASVTSVIATSGAAATRNADNAVVSTIAPWFNPVEGTIVVEGDVNATTADGTARVPWGFSDGTFNESIYAARSASSANIGIAVVDAGVQQSSVSAGSVTANTPFRSAFGYKANDFAHSLNGAAVVTDTSGTLPTVTGLTIGNANWAGAGNWLNGHIRRLSYYNTRLTNAQLQALSTL